MSSSNDIAAKLNDLKNHLVLVHDPNGEPVNALLAVRSWWGAQEPQAQVRPVRLEPNVDGTIAIQIDSEREKRGERVADGIDLGEVLSSGVFPYQDGFQVGQLTNDIVERLVEGAAAIGLDDEATFGEGRATLGDLRASHSSGQQAEPKVAAPLTWRDYTI